MSKRRAPIFSRVNVLADAGPAESLIGILGDEVIWNNDLLLKQSRRLDIYDRMRWRHDEISTAYEALIAPIKGADVKIKPAVTDNSEAGVRQAAILEDILNSSKGYREILAGLLEIPWRGYGGVELTGSRGLGEPMIGEHRLPGAVEIPPESLIFDVLGNPRLQIRKTDDPRLVPDPSRGIDLLQPELRWRFIVAQWGSTKGGNWFGVGIAQRVYWLYWFLTQNLKDWNKALEKYAMPTLIANVSGKDWDTLRERMLTLFKDYVADSGIVNPIDQAEIDTIDPTGKFPAYERMDEVMRKSIRKAILGETLSMDQGDKGSQALGRVHADQLSERQVSVVQWVQDVLSETLIPYLSEAEFGQAFGHTLEIKFEEREDEVLRIQQVQAAADLGLTVNRDELYDALDFAVPDPMAHPTETVELTKAAQQTAPFGQPVDPFGQAPEFFTEGLVDTRNERRKQADLDGLSAGSAVQAAKQTIQALGQRLADRMEVEGRKKVEGSRASKPGS